MRNIMVYYNPPGLDKMEKDDIIEVKYDNARMQYVPSVSILSDVVGGFEKMVVGCPLIKMKFLAMSAVYEGFGVFEIDHRNLKIKRLLYG